MIIIYNILTFLIQILGKCRSLVTSKIGVDKTASGKALSDFYDVCCDCGLEHFNIVEDAKIKWKPLRPRKYYKWK